MASAPLWNQNHDSNRPGLSEFDSFLNSGSGTSAWKLENGGRRQSTSKSLAVNGGHHDSDTESKPDQISGNDMKMDTNVANNTVHTVGEVSRAPRPLKSRPEDRIASITDNPFYKSFAVRHPRSPREVPSTTGAKMSVDADGKFGHREDLGDYKPGSGFVHKLMGKFASLGVKEEPPSLHHIKHASSFDDIADEPQADPQHRDRSRLLSSHKHRARSVETLPGRRQVLPVPLRHVERKWETPAAPAKSPRDTHIVAPDVKLARDDIIIIENTPVEQTLAANDVDDDEDSEKTGFYVSCFKDDLPTDEMPKPNTVSTVRSLFESGMPLSPTSSSSDPFSGDSEPISTPREYVPTPRDSVLTPRDTISTPRDSNSTPRDYVLTPRDSNLTPREPKPTLPPSPRVHSDFSNSQRFDPSKNRFSWSSDVKLSTGVDSSKSVSPPAVTSSALPVSTAAGSSAADTKSDFYQSENVKPTLVHVSGGSENCPIPASPRSTAAVKAVPALRPVLPSRPARPSTTNESNSSVPPSFMPSIKKTSPVMPVAPFKENKAEEEDGNRHLVYEKKKIASKPQRPMRMKNYGEVSADSAQDVTKKLQEDVTNIDNLIDVQKTNKVNRNHGKGRAPPIPKQSPFEDSPVQSPNASETNESQWTDVLKPTSPRIEDSRPEPVMLIPVEPQKPQKAQRTVFSKPEERIVPLLDLSRPDSPLQPDGLMETEEVKEDADTETKSEAPVRGIPSIIANRYKQSAQNQGQIQTQSSEQIQTGPPGELFGVRLGKTRRGEDSLEDSSEIPYKRPTPASEEQVKDPFGMKIANCRSNLGHHKKNTGVSKVFDSSQIKKKPKSAQSKSSAAVPRLDLSAITSDDRAKGASAGGYNVTPREVKPCNIEFIGANVSTGRNMLKKNRKAKINIRFHEVLVETFEYPSEETALENYMKDHPDELLVLEEVIYPAESSDEPEQDVLDTPRGGKGGLETELLKSNTSLAHAGNLQSYRGKFQQEYELGSVLSEPEKSPEPEPEVEVIDPDNMQFLPANEDDTQTWSTDTSSDLLF